MNIRKLIATGAAALTIGSGLALAPAVVAPASSAVVEQAEAAQGWGGICKTTYIYRTVSDNWRAQYRVTWRWWSDSLTGTTCRQYGSPVFVKYVSR